eukprot:CAMPEP_0172366956 /NCGR_PEP_ID=MMETSP1060-20121228/17651_1 /TAXON_ID=37318 /ORGANISM="Pseudo-nitzschia pungens, Strain cf. cingulata" /LENGTH=279 /DNA_ID=CAMNT_0013090993 /DNA_START=332 /DNA_END=1171 /DNA_ORIENTATION=-
MPVSNTSKRNAEKKKSRRTFFDFMDILLEVVEANDPTTFQNTIELIRDYKEKKERGEIDSLSKSLYSPLKKVVGPHNWTEARERLSTRAISYSKSRKSSLNDIIEIEPLPVAPSPQVYCYEEVCSSPSVHAPQLPTKVKFEPLNNNHGMEVDREIRTRRKRLWITICVLMRSLQISNPELYLKARALAKECLQRHKERPPCGEHQNHSLSRNIQSCLKNEIGVEYWRRAETYVARALLDRNEMIEGGKRRSNSSRIKKRRLVPTDDMRQRDSIKRRCFE